MKFMMKRWPFIGFNSEGVLSINDGARHIGFYIDFRRGHWLLGPGQLFRMRLYIFGHSWDNYGGKFYHNYVRTLTRAEEAARERRVAAERAAELAANQCAGVLK